MDLLSRGIFGSVVYFFIFPSIFYPSDLYHSYPAVALGFTGLAFFISILRLVHCGLTKYFYDRFPVLWMTIFKCFSLCHAAILGILFFLVIIDTHLQVAQNITMLVCAGIASASISSLSPNLFMAVTFPQVLLLPSVFVNALNEEFHSFAVVTIIYLVYLSALAIRGNKEYRRTFCIEEQLKQQKKELETLSQTDALTGLYNRGYFNTLYENLWNACVRNNIAVTMVMMDIDHFKQVNDTYGHLSGDECLRVVAKTVSRHLLRKTDISCRFGGEEFAVLLSNTPIQDAERLAETIRADIEATWVEYGDHRFQITASFGLASTLPKRDDKSLMLIERADRALYQAKKQGRNCVCSAPVLL